MLKWHVKLPEGKQLWLESDHPHEDLEKMGYTAYALTDIRLLRCLKNVKYVRAV